MNNNQIIALISKIRRNSSAFLEKEMSTAGIDGLIASHGAILGGLFRNGGKLKMKEIADMINKDKSTVTYLVNGLCKAGYVVREKDIDDSRSTNIVLTQKTWDIEEKLKSISEKLITTAYIGFSEDEKLRLMELLIKLNNNFKD